MHYHSINYFQGVLSPLQISHNRLYNNAKFFILGQCADPGTPRDGIRDRNGPFPTNSIVRFRCNSGYDMTGSSVCITRALPLLRGSSKRGVILSPELFGSYKPTMDMSVT